MDITVDRIVTTEDTLVFTIEVKNPHLAQFGQMERNIMNILSVAKDAVEEIPTQEVRLKQEVIRLIYNAKQRAFERVWKNLTFAIRNDLQPKFDPICQEIYNWIYDAQQGPLKEWMSEFNPQRIQYYFDNDLRSKRGCDKQESEHEIEIDDEDENEEEDE